MADYVPMMIAAAVAGGVFTITGCLPRNGEGIWIGGTLQGGVRGGGAQEAIVVLLCRAGASVPVAVRDAAAVRTCRGELRQTQLFARVIKVLLGASSSEAIPAARVPVRDFEMGVLVAAVLAGGLAGSIGLGTVLGVVVGAAAVVAYLRLRAARRTHEERRRVASAMPEAFAALSIALGSGHTLAQGMRFVGSHAEEPVRGEFLRVACAIECGIPASEALDDLLIRLPAPGLGLVSLALKISQRTGAPLRELLAEAADMANERIALARQLEVKTSQARMSARLVAWMPVAMACALAVVSADYRRGIAMPVGAGSAAVAFALDFCAWMIIRRIMRIDVG
ncbi:type II secretion system F family protein [uncultured Enorma sp.]|uniref:type II secretion system F family protein n=1 Tax=uncultured Enorma sp. TaxID=1714346 RepID=UPI002805742F|nr:type II secretion system F family protein [uncultured Enorma sp.]